MSKELRKGLIAMSNGISNGGKVLKTREDIDLIAPVQAPEINYPSNLTLWSNTVPKNDQVQIINEQDFPLEDLFKSLALGGSPLRSSFGTADYSELSGRYEIVKLLLKSERFRRYVLATPVPADRLPEQAEDFLRFYDQKHTGDHNPFWSSVHRFLTEMALAEEETNSFSTRLNVLKETLTRGTELEVIESQVAAIVTEQITQISVMGGIITYKVDISNIETPIPRIELRVLSEETHGHLRYSTELARLSLSASPRPKGIRGLIKTATGITFIKNKWRSLQRWMEKKRAMRSVVLKTLPSELQSDIEDWLKQHLTKLKASPQDINIGVLGVLRELDGGEVKVAFIYDGVHLNTVVYSIAPKLSNVRDPKLFPVTDHNGYSSQQVDALKRAHQAYLKEYKETQKSNILCRFQTAVIERNGYFFDGQVIPSPKTDQICRWFALRNLYEGKSLRKAVAACEDYRRFFSQHWNRLREIAVMIDSIMKLAQKLNLPLCAAEPLPHAQQIVEFSGIYPIHLLSAFNGTSNKVIPYSLPALNGRMICLTGKHGGGKTTSLVSVLAALYMAQSICLAFGTSFRFNPKRVLASLLIERGQGSTIELILAKMKKILEAANRVPSHQMVAVLDELGSATQESAGDELGRQVLQVLADRGVSTVFATQIQSLAEFADRTLKAHTCYLTRNHRIENGISDGGLRDLCKEMGVTKLLK